MDNNQARISKQSIQDMTVKIELLNRENSIIAELQGLVIDGSLSVEANNSIRRTCNISMVIDDETFLPNATSGKVWMNTKFRLSIGIKDLISDEIFWFNKGEFYFTKPSVSIESTTKILSFTGVDKMSYLNGDNGGILGNITKINAGTPIFNAVKSLVELGGETKYIINDVEDRTIPYDLEEDSTSNILSFLEKIRDLYMGYEMYYNEDGYFIFEKIKNRKFDMSEWVYSENDKMTISFNNAPDWDNVKNKIVIWGREFEDKDKIAYELINKDNGEFCIDKIGERILVVAEDTIYTLDQAKTRAEYELYIHDNLKEEIELQSIQIFGLNVNKVIEVYNKQSGISGRYLVNKLSYNLNTSGVMNITASKIYP